MRPAIARSPRSDGVGITLDERLGQGRPCPGQQWWLDLERSEVGFRVPSRSGKNDAWQGPRD